MRAVVYLRMASRRDSRWRWLRTPRQIRQQREACRRHAAACGWWITREYADIGVSGATLDRDGLQGLLAELKRNRSIKAVVMTDPARLSRRYEHHREIKERLERLGVSLEYVDGSTYPTAAQADSAARLLTDAFEEMARRKR